MDVKEKLGYIALDFGTEMREVGETRRRRLTSFQTTTSSPLAASASDAMRVRLLRVDYPHS